jgi:TrmH family RNA methyltransferase
MLWGSDASGAAVSAPLGGQNADVRRLRSLLRDRAARETDGVFVCEGPRVIAAALDQGVEFLECFVGVDASAVATDVADRAERAGIDVRELAAGVAAKVGATTTPQGIFAVALRPRVGLSTLRGVDLCVVAPLITDPGNAGTLMRSAAAAGASVIVLGPRSVDAYNPKVVRASAGACFAIGILEGVPAMEVLEALGDAGVRRVGAVASGGRAPEAIDLRIPTAIVLGHEAAGLDAELPLDELVTIPMHATESMNVAMAGTVLLHEAARQRRARP